MTSAVKTLLSMARVALVFCSLPAWGHVVSARDPGDPVTKYAHDVWQDKDGLPQNSVLAITQTRDGYLWLGTEVGLARFDGVRFVVFDKKNTPEIKHNFITALFAARDGGLWIGTRGGLTRYKDRRFTAYTSENGLAGDYVRTVYEDAAGDVWAGTTSGLSRLRGDEVVNYSSDDGLSGDNIRAVYQDREESLWVGTTGGVTRISGGKFTVYTTRDGLAKGVVRAITQDRDGGVWIGMEGGGLCRLKDEAFRCYTTADGLSSNLIRTIHEDADGNLWVGTDAAGLNRFRDGKFSALTAADGLSSNVVRAIYEDAERNLWVGTEGGGLNRFREGRVATYTTRDGLSNDFIRAIREDAEGSLWVGTEGGGLNRLRGGRVTVYTVKDGLPTNFITALYQNRRGALWVGTEGGGLSRFDGGRFTSYLRAHGLSHSSVWAICEGRDGSLWIGTGGALDRFKDGKFTTYDEEDGLPSAYVLALHEDRAGTLWVGLRDGGLVRFKDGRFTPYKIHEGASALTVTSFHEDAEGVLWVGTDGGLARLDAGAHVVYSVGEGLFNDHIFQILEDGRGRLWMSSPKGVFHVSKRELNDYAAGASKKINSVAYTTADGMKSAECTGHAQPAGWRTRDGHLWFPTIKGVVRVDPADDTSNKLPPPVHVEQVVVDNQPVNAGGVIKLPASSGEIQFHYTALSFTAPEKVRFRYRLEGLDDDWVEAGARRVAYYTRLPPGDYRFRVIASNNDGVWNEAGAVVAFSKEPRFHQTRPFYLLCLTTLALLAWAIYWLRVRQMESRFALVLQERNRIAREWHDTLVAGFAGILWQLEVVTIKLGESPQVAREQLEVACRMVVHSMTEARRALHDLRSQTLENTDLPTALDETVKHLTAGTEVVARVAVSGPPQRLPGDVEGNLIRIGQEAVTNVVKHAGARRADLELTYEPERVRLRVSDDGRGFDAPEAAGMTAGHFGLTGMRERAMKLGGEFSLRSAPGEGTEITVVVPVANGNGDRRTHARG